jgi:hypothetical protein
MLGRIDAVLSAGEDGNRAALKASPMRRCIDAAGKTRRGGKSGFTEFVGEPLGEFQTGGRCIARTDNRHRRQGERGAVAAHGEKGWRIIDGVEPAGIIGLARGDKRGAQFVCGLDLALGLLARIDFRHGTTTAAARQTRQSLERRPGAAEMIDQGAKSARTRYYGANAGSPKRQPVLLIRGEADV